MIAAVMIAITRDAAAFLGVAPTINVIGR